MPRRIYTYDAGRGWELWNLLSSLGVLFQIAAVLFFVWNIVGSLRRGEPAGDDPWDAWTLEWATTSPPPAYNFDDDADRAQPPAAVGSEASGRSGLEVRMTQRRDRAAAADARRWPLPSRGRVGMACLILTESALFTIFVVAYLFYIGKSLTGPYPRDVLDLPVLATIALLSSSVTITLAVRALRARRRSARSTLWWARRPSRSAPSSSAPRRSSGTG